MAGVEGVGKVVGMGVEGSSSSEDELEEFSESEEDWYLRSLETSSSDSLCSRDPGILMGQRTGMVNAGVEPPPGVLVGVMWLTWGCWCHTSSLKRAKISGTSTKLTCFLEAPSDRWKGRVSRDEEGMGATGLGGGNAGNCSSLNWTSEEMTIRWDLGSQRQ